MKIRIAKDIERCVIPGTHPAGQCLYCQVRAAPAEGEPGRVTKRWIARVTVRQAEGKGRTRDMGLGGAGGRHDLTLAEAREKAFELRKKARDGIDPVEERKRELKAAETEQVTAAKVMTFDECRDAYIAKHEAEWGSRKHARQWKKSLQDHVTPVFGHVDVADVDRALVLRALDPIWNTKTVTANRVRNRIERVLDLAKSRGLLIGDNPARWANLEHELAAPSQHEVEHHPALPYQQIHEFVTDLRKRKEIAARALELLILTATRLNETLGARREEISLADRLWVVPKERMKGRKGKRREHRIPLSDAAVRLLKPMMAEHESEFVFPGDRVPKLASRAIDRLLRRMNEQRERDGLAPYVDPKLGGRAITSHGFRSTFRDWAGEGTHHRREIAEKAIAHKVGDETEEAYQRGDLFEKRRKLMEAWSAYCSRPSAPGKVLDFSKKRATAGRKQGSVINGSDVSRFT
jgi:integrase